MKEKIAIIGGGILGLTLAYKLSLKDFDITIYDENYEWGGLASSLQLDGLNIEKYYHHIFKSDTYIQELIIELGLVNKLKWLKSTSGVWDNNKLINFSSALDILKFPNLNIFQRLRLGIVSFYLQHTSNYKKFDEIKAIDWCNKYFGIQATKTIWQPLLINKFGTFYKDISMSWLWARINDRSSSRPTPFSYEYLGYLDNGFQTLITELVKKCLENNVIMENNTKVISHELKNNINYLIIQNKKGEKYKKEYSKIISTVPQPIFNNIFKNTINENRLEKVNYLGIICLILVLKNKFSDYYWLNITNPEVPFLAIIEHTNFINPNIFKGKNIVYIAKYLSENHKYFSLNKEDTLKIYIPFLKSINSKFEKNWILQSYLSKSKYAQNIVDIDFKIPATQYNISGIYNLNFSQTYPHDRGMNYAVKQAYEFVKKYQI